jgi:hypothetical protein
MLEPFVWRSPFDRSGLNGCRAPLTLASNQIEVHLLVDQLRHQQRSQSLAFWPQPLSPKQSAEASFLHNGKALTQRSLGVAPRQRPGGASCITSRHEFNAAAAELCGKLGDEIDQAAW